MIQGLFPPPPSLCSSYACFSVIVSQLVEEGKRGHVSFTHHQETFSAKGWELGQKSRRQGRGCDSLFLEREAPLNIILASSLFFCSINKWLIPNDSALVKRELHLGAVCSHLTCSVHLADCESVSL